MLTDLGVAIKFVENWYKNWTKRNPDTIIFYPSTQDFSMVLHCVAYKKAKKTFSSDFYPKAFFKKGIAPMYIRTIPECMDEDFLMDCMYKGNIPVLYCIDVNAVCSELNVIRFIDESEIKSMANLLHTDDIDTIRCSPGIERIKSICELAKHIMCIFPYRYDPETLQEKLNEAYKTDRFKVIYRDVM